MGDAVETLVNLVAKPPAASPNGTEPIDYGDAKTKKIVCIVGLAPRNRDEVINEPDDGREVWSLNMGNHWFSDEIMARMTRWFQVHPWEEMVPRQNPALGHLDFLATTKLPVYMEEVRPEVPTSVEYPYVDVCKTIQGNYLTGAPAFMLALAIHEGFEEIRIYGLEMHTAEEWAYERPCFEWLCGIAQGKGIKVVTQPGSVMLKGPVYAKTIDIPSSFISEMHRQLSRDKAYETSKINSLQGRIKQVAIMHNEENGFDKEELVKAHDALLLEKSEAIALLNQTIGKVVTCEAILDAAMMGNDGLGAAKAGQIVHPDGGVDQEKMRVVYVEHPEETYAWPRPKGGARSNALVELIKE